MYNKNIIVEIIIFKLFYYNALLFATLKLKIASLNNNVF